MQVQSRTRLSFPGPSVLEGLARLLDFPGLFGPHLPRVANSGEADWRALADDWRLVGQDLRRVLVRELGAQEQSDAVRVQASTLAAAERSAGVEAAKTTSKETWGGVERLVRHLIVSQLHQCPPQHWEEIEDETESAFRFMEWEGNTGADPIRDPKAYALKIAASKIAHHLRNTWHLQRAAESANSAADPVGGPATDLTSEKKGKELAEEVERELEWLAEQRPEAVAAFGQRLTGLTLIQIAVEMGVSISGADGWTRKINRLVSDRLSP